MYDSVVEAHPQVVICTVLTHAVEHGTRLLGLLTSAVLEQRPEGLCMFLCTIGMFLLALYARVLSNPVHRKNGIHTQNRRYLPGRCKHWLGTVGL
jgi:hypothetical protein